ncbi:MAG: PQQ-binding-like beta-propeller repeat protein [Planctomycetaceae bacterium]
MCRSPGCFLALWACAVATEGVIAGDWPQILGPGRDGIARQERIIERLPVGGPLLLWQRSAGEGFAGVAVAGGRAVLFHREGNDEIAVTLDALTGKELWTRSFPASYGGGVSSDRGPRCVPLIDGDRVFLHGAAGDLHCVSLRSGESVWSRRARQEFQAPEGYFGAGSTPLVDAGLLLVNVGGKAGAGIVAFDLKDGHTVWKATSEQASYSSPIAVTLDGVRHAIFVARLNVVSLDPQTGEERWRLPFGDRGPTVNAASPLAIDGHLFLSASYGIGGVWARVGKTSAKAVWANNETMSSQYATCVYQDGFLYGVDGRADVGAARLRCFEPASGKIRWSQDDFGVANLILADGKLLILRDEGTLVLAQAAPERYTELGRARLLKGTTRALPALAAGLFYVRDTGTLKCFDLGRQE